MCRRRAGTCDVGRLDMSQEHRRERRGTRLRGEDQPFGTARSLGPAPSKVRPPRGTHHRDKSRPVALRHLTNYALTVGISAQLLERLCQ